MYILSDSEVHLLLQYLAAQPSLPGHVMELQTRLERSLDCHYNSLVDWDANTWGALPVMSNLYSIDPMLSTYTTVSMEEVCPNSDLEPSEMTANYDPAPPTMPNDAADEDYMPPLEDCTYQDPSHSGGTGQRGADTTASTSVQAAGGDGGGGGGDGDGNLPPQNWDPNCQEEEDLNQVMDSLGGGREEEQVLGVGEGGEAEAQNEEENMEDRSSESVPQDPNSSPESQVISAEGKKFVADLAAACDEILNGDFSEHTDPAEVLFALATGKPWDAAAASFSDNSLPAILARCVQATRIVASSTFILMMNLLQYRLKIESIHISTGQSRKKITGNLYATEIAKKVKGHRTLERWVKHGAEYTIIASSDMNEGRLVIKSIIPLVTKLRQQFDIKLTTFMSYTILLEHHHRFPTLSPPLPNILVISTANIRHSDAVMDTLSLNCFIKPRCQIKWASCYEANPVSMTVLRDDTINHVFLSLQLGQAPLSLCPSLSPSPSTSLQVSQPSSPTRIGSSPPPSFHPEKNAADVLSDRLVTIDTNFNPYMQANASCPVPWGAPHQKTLEYTEKERAHVESNTVTPTSILDLSAKIIRQLQSGKRANLDIYIKVSSELLDGQTLRINKKDGNFAVIVDTSMPGEIREYLIDKLHILFPETFLPTDSEEESSHQFPSIHFTWYNRDTTQIQLKNL
ncbi:unnamed protein product [Cyclocybe aegerita]|uniref:Uncharacterized protein n=1 Tax=Cyclocybe aegerita TaxID=1973307 RepID=A0A8S0W454_CYCAE|nr:unnamed protein product [Cyclocybe aegerita]